MYRKNLNPKVAYLEEAGPKESWGRYLVNRRLVTYDAHHFVGSVCLVSGELITLGDLGYQLRMTYITSW